MPIVEPTIVPKPWGYERWIANREYCGKELLFFAGKSCSLHFHKLKDETFFLASGLVLVMTGREKTVHELRPGQCFHVPTGMIHQIKALEDSRLIEVSTHHEDEDSIRL